VPARSSASNRSCVNHRDLSGERVGLIEQQANLGFSRGVNIGMRAALKSDAEAVLVINNDAVVVPGCVDVLVRAWQARPSVGLFAPLVLNTDGSEQSTGGVFRPGRGSVVELSERPPNYLTWACVLVPRSTLETIGLLDERFFMYWEDVDFGLRLGDAGLAVEVVPQAAVLHARSVSHSRAGAKIDRYSMHGLTLLSLKRGGRAAWIGLPIRFAGRVVSRLGSRAHVRAVLLGALDGVRAAKKNGSGAQTDVPDRR
jgi:GT2 family glycosyltransferase